MISFNWVKNQLTPSLGCLVFRLYCHQLCIVFVLFFYNVVSYIIEIIVFS